MEGQGVRDIESGRPAFTDFNPPCGASANNVCIPHTDMRLDRPEVIVTHCDVVSLRRGKSAKMDYCKCKVSSLSSFASAVHTERMSQVHVVVLVSEAERGAY